MIQQTSIEAYLTVYADLTDKQKEVYDVIRDNPGVCNQDIAELLGWTINRVTGRTGELRDCNQVVQVGFKRNKDGFKVMCWKVK